MLLWGFWFGLVWLLSAKGPNSPMPNRNNKPQYEWLKEDLLNTLWGSSPSLSTARPTLSDGPLML